MMQSPLSQLLFDILQVSNQNYFFFCTPKKKTRATVTFFLISLLDEICGLILFPKIPQAALQAVSRLLTNPGNSIGQSFSYASRGQQPLQTL